MNSCSNHNTLSIGHRGAKGYVAENTYESISKAIVLGVDGIEIDIFKSLIGNIEELIKVKSNDENIASFRIIADHLRSSSFLIDLLAKNKNGNDDTNKKNPIW